MYVYCIVIIPLCDVHSPRDSHHTTCLTWDTFTNNNHNNKSNTAQMYSAHNTDTSTPKIISPKFIYKLINLLLDYTVTNVNTIP